MSAAGRFWWRLTPGATGILLGQLVSQMLTRGLRAHRLSCWISHIDVAERRARKVLCDLVMRCSFKFRFHLPQKQLKNALALKDPQHQLEACVRRL